MTSARNVGHEVQAEILKAARKGQEALGHAIKTSAGKVRSVKPHDLNLPFANRLPKPEDVAGNVRGIAARLPKPDEAAENARGLARRLPKPAALVSNVRSMSARLPKPEELAGSARNIAARLPKPEELAGSAASLAGKLMASQRKFADQVLRVTTPQLPGRSGSGKNNTGGDSTAKDSTAKSAEDGQASTDEDKGNGSA